MPMLLGGTECAFVASSGGDRDEDRPPNLVVVIREGRLVDGPVEGVRFVSGGISGVTGAEGEFRYEEGNTIGFYIGDIQLGETVPAGDLMSPIDLVPGADIDTPAVINIARLLQSLDAIDGDARITIPASVRQAATRANVELAPLLPFIDYADSAAFNNAASQVVATLTADYPFTAVLVDPAEARAHLEDALSAQISTTVRVH